MKAQHSFAFQKSLVTLMQSQMFKDVKSVSAAAAKKKGKKEAVAPVDARKPKPAAAKDDRPKGPIKKNRKDRRRDQRKEKRRDIKKRVKEEKEKLQQ